MRRCLYCFEEYPDVYNICPACGNSVGCLSAEAGHLKPGTKLHQRYIIGFAAGVGGFGILYRSFDLTLMRTVAVKEFYSSRLTVRSDDCCTLLPADSRCEEEFEFRKKEFLREARFVSDLKGARSIPSVIDFFEENGTAYIVMEYLHGKTLSEYIKDSGCELAFCLNTAIELCSAAALMHNKGKVHRDIAPDNVFVCSEENGGGVKLLDFGAARNIGIRLENRDVILKSGFSSPEQYKPGKACARSDVYSIGAVLYVLLTGVSVPPADKRLNGAEALRTPSDIRPEIPRRLNRAVMKALNPGPLKRFADAGALLCELEKIADCLKVKYEKTDITDTRNSAGASVMSDESAVRDNSEIRGVQTPVPDRLLPGTLIHTRYTVGSVFRREGMCAVYSATDTVLNRKVYLTEFFPKNLCCRDNDGIAVTGTVSDGSFRDGLSVFCANAEKMNGIDAGPGAEHFDDFFRENGTAYLVSRDCGFFPLEEYIRRSGKIRGDKLKRLLKDVAASLIILENNNMCHGNVSPASIYTDGEKSYLRFNSALCYPGNSLNGYLYGNRQRYWSAPELSAVKIRSAQYADRYSLGAAAYYLACTKKPPDACERVSFTVSEGNDVLKSPKFYGAKTTATMNAAIMKSMSLNPADRKGLYELLTEDDN